MGVIPDNFNPNPASGYMKFTPGANKFRVLEPGITGQVWWIEEDGKRKPMRRKDGDKISPSELDADSTIKPFLALVVYNYADNAVQVLEITQKGILNALTNLEKDEDWGDLREYDIKITRTGEGFDTEYQVTASPKKELSQDVAETHLATKVNLEALYEGADPFAS